MRTTTIHVELPYSKKMGRTLVICEYKDFVVASMHFDLNVNKRKESVRVVQKALEKYSKPVFIAGDWNNFPKSPVLKGLKKFVKVVSPEKNVHTYHLRTMKRKEAVIDYIAIDKTHAKDFSVLRSYEVPDRKTSDHSPIVVELKPANRKGRAAMTRKTYCSNLLWQSSLTLLAYCWPRG